MLEAGALRGPVLFLVCLVAGASLGVVALRPASSPDPEPGGALGAATLFPRPGPDAPEGSTTTVERQEALPVVLHACAFNENCQVFIGQRERRVPLLDAEGLERVDLVIAWNARSPATARLTARLLACVPEACGQDQEPFVSTLGPSPLELTYAPGGAYSGPLTLVVSSDDAVPGPTRLHAAPDGQPFTIRGSATFH